MVNIFSVDLEDWYHANYNRDAENGSEGVESIIPRNVVKILDLLDKNGSKCTFFVLGKVAGKFKDILKDIAARGHEIASHGFDHKLVYSQTEKEFREDVRRAKGTLEEIVRKEVKGYRAPSWSITDRSLWALPILLEEGYRYDSSIFPTQNFMYGIKNAPRFAHVHNLVNGNLLEVPPSTVRFCGTNIPFSGGFYFRVCPEFMIKAFSRIVNRSGYPTVFYLHPREIDICQPRLELTFKNRFIHYAGIKNCLKKLASVMSAFPATSIEIFYGKFFRENVL
ncbi:MAG: polysaccharide deacetylase family protein [Synergistaceae bacterium]|jgi:polysaccharide deacetylase family protein (PEP-CTERM system associated)|nr:polysaccharide deacetylase family protein [Synergistaceae bacterium]